MTARTDVLRALGFAIFGYALSILAIVYVQPAHAAEAPGAILYVTLGYADPNGKVPAMNSVPGAGVSNVAFPLPLRVFPHGYRYAVAIGAQNFLFSGNCTAEYVLTGTLHGKAKVISVAKTAPYACGAKAVSPRFFTTPTLPDYKGAATLEATIAFGSVAVTKTVTLFIQ